jgi:hypothetical protein
VILFESEEVEGMSSDSKFKYFFDKYGFKFINLMFYPFLSIAVLILTPFLDCLHTIICYYIRKTNNSFQNTSVTNVEETNNDSSQPKNIENPPPYNNDNAPEYTV